MTGCSHPGIVNIVKETKEIFPELKYTWQSEVSIILP